MNMREYFQAYPTARQELLNTMVHSLFEPQEHRLKKDLNKIIERNSLVKGNTQRCVFYKGTVYGKENYEGRKMPRPINLLDSTVRPAMKTWILDKDKMENYENLRLINYLITVLSFIQSFADIERILPNPLVDLARKAKLQRYKTSSLPETEIQQFLEKNQEYDHLVKRRLVANLIDFH